MPIAKWRKIDFHTHTPESKCFKNRDSISPRQWIDSVKESGLDAVVVTDHNSVGWIGKLRDELKDEDNLFIFPGVELCVGSSYTHIIIIFDPKMSQSDIEQFLIQCGLTKENWGNTEIYVKEERLADLVYQHRHEVLVIPAHFNGPKGICKTLRHNGIKGFYRNIPFDAIEIRNEDDLNEVNNKVNNKAIPKLALVSGSDNMGKELGTHDLMGFGRMFTWVKISEYSLEALRQVFLDHESRSYCVIDEKQKEFDPNYIEHNYISGMKIKNLRHVSDLNFRFSPNLNCIIGGRGTGKSTIIEMIRLALKVFDENQQPKIFDTYKDDSSIDLFYNFGSDKPYLINVSGEKRNKSYTIKSRDGIIENYPAFPISIYSQKELFLIAEDEENPQKNNTSPLLKIIDENIFRAKADFEQKKETIKRDIISSTEQLLSFREQIEKIPILKAEIELATSKLSRVKDVGLLEKRQELNNLTESYTAIRSDLTEYKETIEEIQTIYSNKCEVLIERLKENLINKQKSNDANELHNIISSINEELAQTFNRSGSCIKEALKKLEISELGRELEKSKKEYSELLKNIEGIDIDNIKEIETQISENSIQLNRLQEIQGQAEILSQQIIEMAVKYLDLHRELTEKRNEIINEINSKANNIVLSISPLSDGDRWLNNIRKELGRDKSFESDFLTLKSKLFENGILNREKFRDWLKYILLSNSGDITELLGDENIQDLRFKNIWTEKKKEKTLYSLINFIPEDKVNIKIKNNNELININEGSPGQKTAAILAFILNQGKHPLVIDQPEDDLDNSLIIDLIVENVRSMKRTRQIIIATHNPNIPVLGDAEGIIMLDRDNDGNVVFKNGKKTGCIEENSIKQGICNIMEGGIQSFKKREGKYKYIEY